MLSLPAVLVDLDAGNPGASLKDAEALIGRTANAVDSGGRTENGPKLHAHWRLNFPATKAGIETLCRIREALAICFGGDPPFEQSAQIIPVPGPIRFKGTPKLLQLRTVRPEAIYDLGDIARAIGRAAKQAMLWRSISTLTS